MMTPDEIDKARAAVKKLRPYRPGPRYSGPQSLPTYVTDELNRVGLTVDVLISIIRALDARLTDLEGTV